MSSALLVSDSAIASESLQVALDAEGKVRVAATVRPDAVMSVISEIEHDVIVLDVPIPDGPLLAKRLLQRDPDARIVASGVREDYDNIVAWARTGVMGCVGRCCTLSELVMAVEAATRRERSCSLGVGQSLFHAATQLEMSADAPASERLTARELEIAGLMNYEWSNKQIAAALGVELPTVKNHVHSIFKKLGVHNRMDARRLLSTDSSAHVE